jgi:F-type H+-transporting ATPase subunit a
MKKTGWVLSLLLLMSAPAFAQDGGDVAGTLFRHVLDGNTLELLPFLPPVHLARGFTVDLLMLILAAVLVLVLFLAAFRRPSAKPGGLVVLFETLVLFVRNDIVVPIMGRERGDRWLPFFTTLFLFLLATNLLGLIPAFKTATGNLTVTSALALMVMVLIFAVGIRTMGFGKFFRNLYPEGTPLPIGLFVALLEFVGLIIRSVVLSLRIFANMFAGHLAILSFLVLMFVLNPLFGVISLPFSIFTYTLEVLVAVIQALVFTLLSCIFITLSSTAHEESAHEPPIIEGDKEH